MFRRVNLVSTADPLLLLLPDSHHKNLGHMGEHMVQSPRTDLGRRFLVLRGMVYGRGQCHCSVRRYTPGIPSGRVRCLTGRLVSSGIPFLYANLLCHSSYTSYPCLRQSSFCSPSRYDRRTYKTNKFCIPFGCGLLYHS